MSKNIISLTVLPTRFTYIDQCIKSLLSQEVLLPIYIWIPKYVNRLNIKFDGVIPGCFNHPNIIYKIVDDEGSITKLSYAILLDVDRIITVDDDIYYHPKMTKHLLDASYNYPNKAIGYRGRKFINTDFLSYNNTKPIIVKNNLYDTVDIITGVRGAIYRKSFFEKDFFKFRNYYSVTFNDDIWISGYLKNKNIDRIVIPQITGKKDVKILKSESINPLFVLNKKIYKNKYQDEVINLFWNNNTVIPAFCFISKIKSDNFAIPYLKGLHEKGIKIKKIIFNPGDNLENILKIFKKDFLVWKEWGVKNINQILNSNVKKLIRIHDWEVYGSNIEKYDWNKANILWFINKNTRYDFYKKVGYINIPMVFLPNAIDTSKFGRSGLVKGKNIVSYSISLKRRKRFDRLIDLFKLIYNKDNEWRLYIKSYLLHNESKKILEELQNKVKILGLNDVVIFDVKDDFKLSEIDKKEDINNFLSDKDIIVSTSEHEGFHYIIPEAISCGLYPVVYNWEWGRAVDFWKPYVKNSIEEMADEILNFGKLSDTVKEEKINEAILYVNNNFSKEILSTNFKNMFLSQKKLLFITHRHPYKYKSRGAEKSIYIIINYLRQVGYNIFVINRDFNGGDKNNGLREENNGVIYYNFSTNFFRDGLREIINKEHIDLAISYASAMKEAYPILMEKKLKYICLIRWFRLIQPLPPGDMMLREIDKDFIKENEDIFKNASSIITNNKYSTKIIKRFYGVSSRYSYVPIFKKIIKTNILNKNDYILVVSPRKGLSEIETLKKLAEQMPNENFLAVNCPKKYIGVYNNLEFVEYIFDMDKIFCKTKILLYIAYYNDVCGTSRVAIEAMRWGIPVISNNRSGLNEVIPYSVPKEAKILDWINQINCINNNLELIRKKVLDLYIQYDSYSQLDVFIEEINKIFKNEE